VYARKCLSNQYIWFNPEYNEHGDAVGRTRRGVSKLATRQELSIVRSVCMGVGKSRRPVVCVLMKQGLVAMCRRSKACVEA